MTGAQRVGARGVPRPRAPNCRYDAPVLLLVDLDGVVYRGAEPVPGVAAVLAARAARGDDVVYVTNNSMFYRADYVDRLAAMGAPVTADRVVSSPRATALWLTEQEPRPQRMLAVGGARAGPRARRLRVRGGDRGRRGRPWPRRPGSTASRPPAGRTRSSSASIPGFTYERLAVAADAVRAGARFVATNRDPIYPTERGLRPGAGSMVAAIEVAAGVVPIVDRQARAAAPPRGGAGGRRAIRATR